MDEIGNFFVKFTTEGLTELKQGLAETNKSLDTLTESLKKTGGHNDSFFGKFAGWATSVGLLTAAILAVKKAITETFEVAKDVRGIYKLSDTLGVDPETIERWEILARLYDGGRGDVAGFFGSLNNLSLNLREGKYSKEMMERMARYGFTEQYLYNASLPTNRDKVIGDLNALFNRRDLDAADFAAIREVFGISDTMVDILKAAPDALKNNLAWAEGNRALTADPDYDRQAIELRKTQIEVEQQLKNIWLELMPTVRDLLEAVKPLLEPIKELVGVIAELAIAIMPIVEWATKQLGGSLGALADTWKLITGKMSLDEFDQKYSKADNVAGKVYRAGGAAGEWLGNVLYRLTKDTAPTTIDLSNVPAESDLGRQLAAGTFIGSQDRVSGTLEIDFNGENYTQDSAGNIYNKTTGAMVGNIPKSVALSSVKS